MGSLWSKATITFTNFMAFLSEDFKASDKLCHEPVHRQIGKIAVSLPHGHTIWKDKRSGPHSGFSSIKRAPYKSNRMLPTRAVSLTMNKERNIKPLIFIVTMIIFTHWMSSTFIWPAKPPDCLAKSALVYCYLKANLHWIHIVLIIAKINSLVFFNLCDSLCIYLLLHQI